MIHRLKMLLVQSQNPFDTESHVNGTFRFINHLANGSVDSSRPLVCESDEVHPAIASIHADSAIAYLMSSVQQYYVSAEHNISGYVAVVVLFDSGMVGFYELVVMDDLWSSVIMICVEMNAHR
ncbi:hypothetical protein Tco_0024082 [Tanacetum coccineum]